MRIIRTLKALQQVRTQWQGRVGFVPTLGYLHAGHLSLYNQARQENQTLVGSIFVNPTQFSAHEDFDSYPRDEERDLTLLAEAGVDVAFLPTAQEMYPRGFTTYVVPEGPVSHEGEGAIRPEHFRGVATVVMKLFQLVQPHTAYFGQKDAQQVVVIARMVEDLNLPVSLRILPTMRESDGLAMSSRNTYLTANQRTDATILYQALKAGKRVFDADTASDPQLVKQAMVDTVATRPDVRLDYAEIRDPSTFEPLDKLQAPALLLIAAHVGTTRLLDNFALHADGSWDSGMILPNGT